MWCTRWYLPLVLLPLPIAPPYFLALFLLSTTLHARPCFYCIVLLSSMFMASCYWPPPAINTPLSEPWSDNITTFADAVLSRLPGLPLDMLPATIPLVDRCWCELSEGLFEPFNTTRWEMNSVERLIKELQQKMRDEGIGAPVEVETPPGGAANLTDGTTDEAATELRGDHKLGAFNLSLKDMWDFMLRSPHALSSNSNTSNPTASLSNDTASSLPTAIPPTASPSSAALSSHTHTLSTLPKEFDLRPYGFDMVLDFRWES
ncbi:hypothetical protein BDW22DRAFT_1483215 [Trametopsis cervina]|nr:hypothetical protein BDW22DRAFT_1483215 [Trametopsis cervina]